MRIVIDKGLQVRVRDGVALAADIYRPVTRDPLVTLLQRTPYNKDRPAALDASIDVLRAVAAGYAVVVQDVRGRYGSEGRFEPFVNEAADGADTVEWIRRQPWSAGTVGMIGSSYVGATQWLAASNAPHGLGAIAPMVTGDDYYEGWTYNGGALQLGFGLYWALSMLGLGEVQRLLAAGKVAKGDLEELLDTIDRTSELYDQPPLSAVPSVSGAAPYYLDWLSHDRYDDYWRTVAPKEAYPQVVVPAFNIGGWYDLFLGGTLRNYRGMRKNGGSEHARSLQRLTVGPWAHGVYGGTFAERSFGIRGGTEGADITGAQLRWFDYCLRGIDNGADRDPPVRVFVMGANRWRDADDWPPSDSTPVRLYLHSGGQANSRQGDGALFPTAPAGHEPPDEFLFDPSRPVPTVGGGTFLPGLNVGANSGPRDQAHVELRDDVLCYTTEPLRTPVEAAGPVTVVLHVSTSVTDTDFTAKLVDVEPGGRAINVTDGIVRLRYRESLSEPRDAVPGTVYRIRIDMAGTAYYFAAGHRIRLEVSSSNFPKHDRNAPHGLLDVAHNTVHHAQGAPSYLELSVVSGENPVT